MTVQGLRSPDLGLQKKLDSLAEILMFDINNAVQDVYPGFPLLKVTPEILERERTYTFKVSVDDVGGINPDLVEDVLEQSRVWLGENMMKNATKPSR